MTISDVRRKVADTLRAERARQRLSQAQVAERAGVAPRRIVQLENGTADPRFSTLEKVSEALGLHIKVEAA